MRKNINTKANPSPTTIPAVLTGVAGEYFVAAELSRRGYIASISLRNTRGIDIVATNQGTLPKIETCNVRVRADLRIHGRFYGLQKFLLQNRAILRNAARIRFPKTLGVGNAAQPVKTYAIR